ncbi:MAG: hypothetical protein ACRD9W_28100, partial [Terriglobia bacterium]
VFAGGNFLVAYQSGTSVVTRRFSRDGRPVDSQPVVISNTGMLAWLATNGKSVFLATAQNRFRLLAPDGTPLGPEHDIPNAGSGNMSVASNGDRYLIAYPSNADGFLQGTYSIVDANGGFLVSQPIQLPEQLLLRAITVSSNGSGFLIILSTYGPVGCQYVDASTGVATPMRIVDSQFSWGVVATWTGNEYTLVWPQTLSTPTEVTGHDIVAARVDGAGTPLDAAPFKLQSVQAGAAFGSAWNGRDTIIITGDSDGNFTNWHTTAAIFKSLPQIDAEPASRRHAAIASSAAEQAAGSIASNGTISLLTWRESTGLDRTVVRTAFIAADGELGAPINLGDAHPQST